MKALYLDIFSGISGDMFIGALLDLGAPFDRLQSELGKLGLNEFHLHVARGQKCSIEGVKFDVHLEEDHGHSGGHRHEHEHEHTHTHSHGGHSHTHSHSHHSDLLKPFPTQPISEQDHQHEDEHHHHEHGRTYAEIRELISNSSLSQWVKEKASGVFYRIAVAEGKIHGKSIEEVHFHEVGAIDSIVDIVGGCIALELLGKPRLFAGPVVEGHGFVNCAHGRFPIPAPATLNILADRGVAITQCDEPHELITPTGAALLAELVEAFGPMQNFKAERVGYGLGTRDNQTRPNVLRVVLGETVSNESSGLDWETDQVAVLETNLDDISSEIVGYVVDQAFAKGALDVFHTPIQMKKNRPGTLLTILTAAQDADRFTEMLLRETSSLGVRRSIAERRKLSREIERVQTEFGVVEVKVGKLNGKVIQASPEFESCRTIAAARDIPLKQVYQAALRAHSQTNLK